MDCCWRLFWRRFIFLKNDLIPERIRFERGVWSDMANIWEPSVQKSPLSLLNYFEWSSSHNIIDITVEIVIDTSNSDPASFILNEPETRFASGMERPIEICRDPFDSNKFSNLPQLGNFGWMDRAEVSIKAGVTSIEYFTYETDYG